MLKPMIAASVSALILFSAAPALAMNFVTGPDYPPFTDPSLPEGGMSSAVVKHVYELIGKPATVEFLPWKRGYEATLSQKFDGTFPYVSTKEREQLFLFSAPLSELEQVVYMNADKKFTFTSPTDLANKTICNELGSGLPKEVEAMASEGRVKVESPPNLLSCIKMLSIGRADFMIRNRLSGDAAIKASGVAAAAIVTAQKPYAVIRHHLLIPKDKNGADAAMAEFNVGLAKLRESGELDRIIARYITP
jgi:polar amino acid transport system substrate-binding protein